MTTIRLRLLSQRKNASSDYSVLKARPSIARQDRESWKTTSVAKRNPAVVANDSKSWIADKYWTETQKCVILIQSNWSVSMTVRFHLFPFRTQKLSLLVPKIVSWKRLVKISSRRLKKRFRNFPEAFFGV